MGMESFRVVLDGIHFGEGPRWRNGELWFSDMHGHQVIRTDLKGGRTVVAEFDFDEPSGLGWLPDGDLLVVAMETGQLMRVDSEGKITMHADLSGIARGSINDMIVRSDGTAYVGDMGMRLNGSTPDKFPGQTIMVTPDGRVSCAADDLNAPNGHILNDDETELIVAQSGGGCLTKFDVAADGTLSNQRNFATIEPAEGFPVSPPDGVCLDAAGAVWSADPYTKRVVRVEEGGKVTDVFTHPELTPFACVLGGPDRKTLLICMALTWGEATKKSADGIIAAIDVAIPGAGYP
jgi:sugar lactone lactonase YvrE